MRSSYFEQAIVLKVTCKFLMTYLAKFMYFGPKALLLFGGGKKRELFVHVVCASKLIGHSLFSMPSGFVYRKT